MKKPRWLRGEKKHKKVARDQKAGRCSRCGAKVKKGTFLCPACQVQVPLPGMSEHGYSQHAAWPGVYVPEILERRVKEILGPGLPPDILFHPPGCQHGR